jgi:hypothetical protein
MRDVFISRSALNIYLYKYILNAGYTKIDEFGGFGSRG